MRIYAIRGLIATGIVLMVSLGLLELIPAETMFAGLFIIHLFTIFYLYQLNYLNPVIAFSVPWLTILGFTLLDLSQYSRPVGIKTYGLIFFALYAAIGLSLLIKPPKKQRLVQLGAKLRIKTLWFWIATGIYGLLSVLNVAIAGYIPLIRGFLTGDTGYIDFGLPGLYGFYNAYSNALAIFSFYLFLLTGRKRYLRLYLTIIAVFILFVTRQNVVSILVESLVIYSFVRRPISTVRLALMFAVFLVCFAILGQFRSGDIKAIVGVKTAFDWVPTPFIWLYAYSYFNVLNLDNLIYESQAPYFDGSAFAQLIPSIFRPAFGHAPRLEVKNFNVTSYLYPLYQDMGARGAVIFTVLALSAALWFYRRSLMRPNFNNLGIYAVLYYCGLFSFFINNWFYLPIIFQIPFISLLSRVVQPQVIQERARPQSATQVLAG